MSNNASVASSCCMETLSWSSEGGLSGFGRLDIAFPALIFKFNMLDGYRICIGVEIGKGLEFRHPAAVHSVGDSLLPRFVIHLNNEIFTKVLQRYLPSETGFEILVRIKPLRVCAKLSHNSFLY